MYHSDTEMLFPSRVIPTLKNLRGPAWRDLIEAVAKQPEGSEENLAFGLLMIRLNSCLSCHSDSYRAMRGCTLCAQQTVARFKDKDDVLLRMYKQAHQDIKDYQHSGKMLES